jgi:hypothetical protein
MGLLLFCLAKTIKEGFLALKPFILGFLSGGAARKRIAARQGKAFPEKIRRDGCATRNMT